MNGQNQSNISQDTNFAQVPSQGQSPLPANPPAQAGEVVQQPTGAMPPQQPTTTVPTSPVSAQPSVYSAIGGKRSLGAKGVLSWVVFIILAILIIAGTGYYVLFYSKNPNSSLGNTINIIMGRNPAPPLPEAQPEIPSEVPPVVTDTAPPAMETAPIFEEGPINTNPSTIEGELEEVKPEELDDFEGIQVPGT